MITFRKIEPDDLDKIYGDEVLRTLITIPVHGERFAIVMEEDGAIKGGVSGYRQGEDAFIQCVAVSPGLEEDSLLDGLIRSLVYILDREGVQRLFAMKDKNEHLYEKIGFKRVDTNGSIHCLVLDVPDFFNHKPCR